LPSPELYLCVDSGMESPPRECVNTTNFAKLLWNIHVLPKLWVIWSTITKTTLKLLFISLALLKISCTAGKVIMTVFISVIFYSLFLSSCLFCYRWSCFAALSLPVFSLCFVLFFFFFFFHFLFELWFSVFTLLYPPSFVAPEYLCLIQCLITVRKAVIFCKESSLPRVSIGCRCTDRCFISLLGKKKHDENLN